MGLHRVGHDWSNLAAAAAAAAAAVPSVLPETDSDETELYDLSDRYFKVTVIKIFAKIKKTLHEPSENFNKEMDNTESTK